MGGGGVAGEGGTGLCYTWGDLQSFLVQKLGGRVTRKAHTCHC